MDVFPWWVNILILIILITVFAIGESWLANRSVRIRRMRDVDD